MFGRVSGGGRLWRSRYAAFGAAVAVSVGAGGLVATMASPVSNPSSFVPISPCRIMDTRADTTVGPRNTALAGGVNYTIQVRGLNGNCDIPAGATAVNVNLTSTNATTDGFLTVWPADAARPLSSSLNWVAGQAPTPNSVNATLGATGQVSFFASAGSVDLIADVTGYFVPGGGGASGPAGPVGAPGAAGPVGPSGVVVTATISGFIDSVFAAGNYQFLGPTAQVTTTASQRLTASAMVPLGITGSTPATIQLDLCYQASGSVTPPIGFSGGSYSVVHVSSSRVAQAVAATVVPGAGTWTVGACALTAVTLNNNNFVNGYVQVTN